MIVYTLPLDQLPDPLPIEPLTKPFDVTITPPGSKSITCRAYVLAALAGPRGSESKIIRPLRADDTDLLLKALCTLGAEARWEGEDVYIKGVAGRFPRGGSVYLGDGGTPTRFMIACACLAAEPVIVDASGRMRQRPIAEGVDMLRQLGAKIEYVEEEGRLPVRVIGISTSPQRRLELNTTISSQFVSAALLIAPHLCDGIEVEFTGPITSRSYVELTVAVMHEFGVVFTLGGTRADTRFRRIEISRQRIARSSLFVQPDSSSAVFWWTAAALNNGSVMRTPGIGVEYSEPDAALEGYLRFLGCEIWTERVDADDDRSNVVCFRGSTLRNVGHPLDMSRMPDASMSLGALSVALPGPIRITGLRTLRVKETDRIAALANELRKVGCAVETGEDWIAITPPGARDAHQRAATVRERAATGEPLADARGSYEPVVIETYNDHRMAMAFAVLGLARPGISIRNPACVSKSYPTFWKDFARLYQ